MKVGGERTGILRTGDTNLPLRRGALNLEVLGPRDTPEGAAPLPDAMTPAASGAVRLDRLERPTA